MIISCPNCKKKFNIDSSLIPKTGRDLKCGSCDFIWFYKNENENILPKLKNENININDDKKEDNETKQSRKLFETKKNIEKTKEIKKNEIAIIQNKTQKNLATKVFSYLIVFIISFVALVIIMDTFKKPLITAYPDLEVILFNLFETLQDIKLFIIDLY